jgi:lysophospholipase L1-like esterase
MRRLKDIAVNASLSAASLLLGLLFCEFFLFRFVLLPSDVPANAFANELVRYAPNQSGVWRIRNDVAAPYAINAQGWNTGVGDYARERRPGIRRIAVVGDSMIEAMQVAHDRSMAERLAAETSRPDNPVEVYRFAIAGAPATQYLHMIEREVLAYKPDLIVVLLIHNDFDEMFEFVQGRYTSSFLKLRMVDGRVEGEIPPTPWKPGVADWIRRSATARYLYYRWQVRPGALRDLLLGTARAEGRRYEANIDADAVLSRSREIQAATEYVFGRLKAVTEHADVPLLIVMDGVRDAIYRDAPSDVLALNRLAAGLAAENHIPFLDLHPVFKEDWAANRQRFDFAFDGHWNEHGHAVAARAVAASLATLR